MQPTRAAQPTNPDAVVVNLNNIRDATDSEAPAVLSLSCASYMPQTPLVLAITPSGNRKP